MDAAPSEDARSLREGCFENDPQLPCSVKQMSSRFVRLVNPPIGRASAERSGAVSAYRRQMSMDRNCSAVSVLAEFRKQQVGIWTPWQDRPNNHVNNEETVHKVTFDTSSEWGRYFLETSGFAVMKIDALRRSRQRIDEASDGNSVAKRRP